MARPVTKLKGIEAAALELFSKGGVNQVTIKDISQHAGCTEGALYRHYVSKDELAWTLYRREVERFGARLRAVLQGDGPILERVRQGVQVFYGFFDEDPVTFSFILLSQHHFPQEQDLSARVNPVDMVIKFVREGARSGDFRISEPDLGAAMVMGLVLQPAMMRVTGRLKGPMTNRVSTVTEACLRILHAETG